jgi:hypothetical protein
MEAANDATLVPIALTIGGHTGVTLWAPPWVEDGEEWQAFLGSGDRVTAFASPDELAAYLPRSVDNDLVDHPAWELFQTLPVTDLTPDEDFRFDFDAVVGLLERTPEKGPYDETASTLGDLVDLAQRIAECTEDGALLNMLEAETFTDLMEDDDADYDEDDWEELVRFTRRAWPLLVDRLDARISWATSAEDAEQTPAAGARAVTVGAVVDGETTGTQPEPTRNSTAGRGGSADAVGTADTSVRLTAAQFWDDVGIAPVQFTVPDGTAYTLRCFSDDAAVFLGRDLEIDVFRTPAELAAYVRSAEEHDLTGFDTWPRVQERDDLDATPLEEDVYDLTIDTPEARELAGDIAGYCELAAVLDTLDDDPATDALEWPDVLAEIVSCLRWND